MKKSSFIVGITFILCILFASQLAIADDWYEDSSGYYTIQDQDGKELTMMAREIFIKDEYISSDNKHYAVRRVDKKNRKAVAEYIDDIKLPEIEEISVLETAAQAKPSGSILLYCTHSDESYIPSDGAPSKRAHGGVFDVAQAFKTQLEKRGVKVHFDRAPHDPHDAGAYRRSRNTAISLIKKYMPVAAMFDIHRDAVPGYTYKANINGEDITKVRIVLGGGNQNKYVNKELAYKVKAVADKAYPGLIKDIYIGQGSYNQELSPHSLLFEFGTHENAKEAAEASTKYLADVVVKSIYGGTIKSKQYEKTPQGTQEKIKQYRAKPIAEETKQGSRKGIIWLLVVLGVGIAVYLFISSGSREFMGGRKRD